MSESMKITTMSIFLSIIVLSVMELAQASENDCWKRTVPHLAMEHRTRCQ